VLCGFTECTQTTLFTLTHLATREPAHDGAKPCSPLTLCLAFLAERLRTMELWTALRTLGLISLGLYSQYWLLLNVSGFKSPSSALACMLLIRSLLAHPYLHVNIFQVRPPSALVLHSPRFLATGWTQDSGRERTPEEAAAFSGHLVTHELLQNLRFQ
jgi:hypothetical protein